jgi:protein TonB
VLKDIGNGTSAEAIRVLKASPKWMAGKQNGKPVRVEYSMPINIRSSK